MCVHCKSVLGEFALERDPGWVIRSVLGSTQFGRRGICLGLNPSSSRSIFYFLKDFTYLFLESGEGREKEKERNIEAREKHQSVASRTHTDQD